MLHAYQLGQALSTSSIFVIWAILCIALISTLAFTMTKEAESYFYEDHADGTIRFPNGDTLKVNTVILGFHVPEIIESFISKGKKEKDKIMILERGDKESFKEFLDVAVGIVPLEDQGIRIYPKAVKYMARKVAEKCEEIFMKSNDDEFVEIVKMGVENDCVDLIEKLKQRIDEDMIVRLLAEKALNTKMFKIIISNRTMTRRIMDEYVNWATEAFNLKDSQILTYLNQFKFEHGASENTWEKLKNFVKFCSVLADTCDTDRIMPREKEITFKAGHTLEESFVFDPPFNITPSKQLLVSVLQNPCSLSGTDAYVQCEVTVDKTDDTLTKFKLEPNESLRIDIPGLNNCGIKAFHVKYTFPTSGKCLTTAPDYLLYKRDANKLYYTREILFSLENGKLGPWSRTVPRDIEEAGPSHS